MKESFIPMNVDSWDDHDTFLFEFTGEMTRDFGPWKKGDKVSLVFDLDEGFVEELYDNGDVKHRVNLRLAYINEDGQLKDN